MIGKFRKSRSNAVPGFGLSLSSLWSTSVSPLLIPLCALVVQSTTLGWQHFYPQPQVGALMASYRLTIGTSLAAAAINAVAGLLVAWVLARYRFRESGSSTRSSTLPFATPLTFCRHRAYFALRA